MRLVFKHHPNLAKLAKVVKLRREGKTFKEIGKVFKQSERSIANFLKSAVDNGYAEKSLLGLKTKFKPEIINLLLRGKKPHLIQKELKCSISIIHHHKKRLFKN